MMDDGEFRTKAEEKAHLTTIIQEWNASRLDMFALTLPDKDLEFHGVVRFYFQDDRNKVITKCIRVSSKTTVAMLMDTLVEKFCPDLKMLTHSNYELFECHEKGDTRKLGKTERPLLVQLSWHRDDREGRFLLKSASAKVTNKFYDLGKNDTQFKRRLSKREKKELKKQRKQEVLREHNTRGNVDPAIAQKLYDEKPESSLTRSISNPEAVMKRRREQKIQQRLAKYQAGDGQQRGGTLKIFAESLKPEIPYKTILASINQTSDTIVKDALEKFQLENEVPEEYCLVMKKIPPGENPGPGRENVVKDQDCPLAIQSSWPASRGFLTFHLRKRTTVAGHKKNMPKQKSAAELQADKRAAERLALQNEKEADEKPEELPYLLEVLPEDMQGDYDARIFYIRSSRTIVGSNPTPLSDQYISLYASDIFPEHCVIESSGGQVTIAPANPDARVIVNDIDIYETVPLEPGSLIIIANSYMFQYNEPKSIKQLKTNESSRNMSPYGVQPYEASPMRDERPASLSKDVVMNLPGSGVDDLTVVTTFGIDGEVASSPERKTDPKGNFIGNSAQLDDRGDDPYQNQEYMNGMILLPAALQFVDDAQDAFFAAIISEVNGAAVHFKLAPAYSLYLACHYLISPDFRPELGQTEHGHVVSSITKKMAVAIEKTIQENDALAGNLAFWLANASELLHFLKQDTSLSLFTETAQGIMAQSVQHAFRLLVLAMEEELGLAMPAFLDPSQDADIPENELENILDDDVLERADSTDLLNWTIDERTFAVHDGRAISGDQWITPAARIRHHGRPVMADVLYILSSAMSLLRRCRVNAALTIQLFSQLFHFLNMWLFNKLVLNPQLGLCTKAWGRRLKRRLGYVEAWAEKQGLELAADCHLCRVVQAAHLLDAPKVSAEDIASISSECFKLNSLQLKVLLKLYRPDRGEHVIPQELIDNVVAVAEHTADELIRTDGREVQLEEDAELQLPFLLPEDGYSCDIIRGVPQGLQEFLQPLEGTGICRFHVSPDSTGLWTVHQEYFEDDTVDVDEYGQPRDHYPYENHDDKSDEKEIIPETISVTLQKGNRGLGLSIVAAEHLLADVRPPVSRRPLEDPGGPRDYDFQGSESQQLGIYIKGVIDGGTAHQNGMLEPFDQIISVNGVSLVGVTQEGAAKLMGQSGPTVVLEIIKQAAVHHGLAHLLIQSSPGTSPAPPKEPKSLYDKVHESTINENSPQIRTQRWIENHGSVDRKEEDEEERRKEEEEEERRRIAAEERMAEERRIREEEEARREEELRQAEEEQRQQEEEMRRIEENKRLMEEARKEREAQIRQQQEEDKKKFLEEQRLKQQRRAEAERREREEREERERRILEEKLRKEKEEEEKRKLEEERRLEELRIEEERIAEQKRLEEEEEQRRMEEERRKFEQREREYEARLRFFEEQQRKREMEEARLQEEKRQEEERKKREEEVRRQEEARKEQERLDEAKKIKEELKKQEEKRKEEERKRIESERLRREEESRRYQEEEERRIKEERRRQMEKRMREEEERQRQEELLRQHQGISSGNSRVYSENYQNNYEDDLDYLPPPPEDLLLEENGGNSNFNEDTLEHRTQNQLVGEQRERNDIVREQYQIRQGNYSEFSSDDRQMAQRSQQLKSSGQVHSFYSSDEDPHDIEQEFQRRLQLENERLSRRKKDYDLDDVDHQRIRSEREQRAEQERKVQLMMEDHARRPNRSERNVSDSSDSQRRAERGGSSGSSQRNSSTEDEWFAMQRRNHLEKKREQERLRQEQLESEERERQRKQMDVRNQREQEKKMMEEYQRQKELKESRERSQRQPQYSPIDRRANSEDLVKSEFRQKAFADYERRRETLDKEVERAEREKRIRSLNVGPPQIAKKPTQRRSPIDYDDNDEPAPPRPPPPSSLSPPSLLSPASAGRSPSSTSPQPARGDRFSFSQNTVASYNNSYGNTRHSSTSPSGRIYSPTRQYQQPRSGSSSRAPSREDPAALDFSQKMKMFGAKSNDTRSTFSKKQREYMD